MYKKILVTLDKSEADRVILEHIKRLARCCQSQVVLLHVASGWAARQFGVEAVSPEVTEARAYLQQMKEDLTGAGLLNVTAEMAYGDPSEEIVRWIEREHCDLVAMGTHGHRFLGDLVLGSTASTVQHRVEVPVLLIKTPAKE